MAGFFVSNFVINQYLKYFIQLSQAVNILIFL